MLCYDDLTEDLLKAELRDGAVYSSRGVVEFMQPLLDEYLKEHPSTALYLRGDSDFASPELFKQCECNGVSYVIRLKDDKILYFLTRYAEEKLAEQTTDNLIDYAVAYDEFYYQAGSWDYPRRIIVKIEKPYNQFTYQYYFRRLLLSKNMRNIHIDTIRLKLIKIASKAINSARYIYFKLYSSFPYQKEFREVLKNIQSLPQLE